MLKIHVRFEVAFSFKETIALSSHLYNHFSANPSAERHQCELPANLRLLTSWDLL